MSDIKYDSSGDSNSSLHVGAEGLLFSEFIKIVSAFVLYFY